MKYYNYFKKTNKKISVILLCIFMFQSIFIGQAYSENLKVSYSGSNVNLAVPMKSSGILGMTERDALIFRQALYAVCIELYKTTKILPDEENLRIILQKIPQEVTDYIGNKLYLHEFKYFPDGAVYVRCQFNGQDDLKTVSPRIYYAKLPKTLAELINEIEIIPDAVFSERFSSKDLKGNKAPDTNDIIRDLILSGEMIELVYEDNSLKAYTLNYVENYSSKNTKPSKYRGRSYDIKNIFNDDECDTFLKYILKNMVNGKPVKFRIALGKTSLGWETDIDHSNISHAGIRDGVVYIGRDLLKRMFQEDNETLRDEVLKKDEFMHLAGKSHGTKKESEARLQLVKDTIDNIAIRNDTEEITLPDIGALSLSDMIFYAEDIDEYCRLNPDKCSVIRHESGFYAGNTDYYFKSNGFIPSRKKDDVYKILINKTILSPKGKYEGTLFAYYHTKINEPVPEKRDNSITLILKSSDQSKPIVPGSDRTRSEEGWDTATIKIYLNDTNDKITMIDYQTRKTGINLSRTMIGILLHDAALEGDMEELHQMIRKYFVIPEISQQIREIEELNNGIIPLKLISHINNDPLKATKDELAKLKNFGKYKSWALKELALICLRNANAKGVVDDVELAALKTKFETSSILEDRLFIQRYIIEQPGLIEKLLKNLSGGREISRNDISSIGFKWLGRGNNKSIYRLMFHTKNGEVFTTAVSTIRHNMWNINFDRESLKKSMEYWKELSDRDFDGVPKLIAYEWAKDFNSKMLDKNLNQPNPEIINDVGWLRNDICLAFREFMEGNDLKWTLASPKVTDIDKIKFKRVALQAILDIWNTTNDNGENGLFVGDPKPANICVNKADDVYKAQLIDLDLLRVFEKFENVVSAIRNYSDYNDFDIVLKNGKATAVYNNDSKITDETDASDISQLKGNVGADGFRPVDDEIVEYVSYDGTETDEEEYEKDLNGHLFYLRRMSLNMIRSKKNLKEVFHSLDVYANKWGLMISACAGCGKILKVSNKTDFDKNQFNSASHGTCGNCSIEMFEGSLDPTDPYYIELKESARQLDDEYEMMNMSFMSQTAKKIEDNLGTIMKGADEYRIKHSKQAVMSFRSFIKGDKGFEFLFNNISNPEVSKRTPDKQEYFDLLNRLLELYNALSDKEKTSLLLAVILHDNQYLENIDPKDHWQLSSENSEKILRQYGVWDEEVINNVKELILLHGVIYDFGEKYILSDISPILQRSDSFKSQVLLISLMDVFSKLSRGEKFVPDNIVSSELLREDLNFYDEVSAMAPQDFFNFRLKRICVPRSFRLNRNNLKIDADELEYLKQAFEPYDDIKKIWSTNMRMNIFPLFKHIIEEPRERGSMDRAKKLQNVIMLFGRICEVYLENGRVPEGTILTITGKGSDFSDKPYVEILNILKKSGLFNVHPSLITKEGISDVLENCGWSNIFGVPLLFDKEKIFLSAESLDDVIPGENVIIKAGLEYPHNIHNGKYTLLVDQGLYRSQDEYKDDRTGYEINGRHVGYADRFDVACCNSSDIDNVISNAEQLLNDHKRPIEPSQLIIQISRELSADEINRIQDLSNKYEKNGKPGIKAIYVNSDDIAMVDDKNLRRDIRFDLYSMMVLARSIDQRDLAGNTATSRLLNFLIRTHFNDNDKTSVEDMIKSLAKGDLAGMLKYSLSLTPIGKWNGAEKYRSIAQIFISA
ncbi:MAG: hypothetical protein HQL29_00065 [Candidatus Omnitrophica bacterium]|nr:hypothetical protein [Candidatus Omnitrophota bacterium]